MLFRHFPFPVLVRRYPYLVLLVLPCISKLHAFVASTSALHFQGSAISISSCRERCKGLRTSQFRPFTEKVIKIKTLAYLPLICVHPSIGSIRMRKLGKPRTKRRSNKRHIFSAIMETIRDCVLCRVLQSLAPSSLLAVVSIRIPNHPSVSFFTTRLFRVEYYVVFSRILAIRAAHKAGMPNTSLRTSGFFC